MAVGKGVKTGNKAGPVRSKSKEASSNKNKNVVHLAPIVIAPPVDAAPSHGNS